ncbi:uncharacterized protein LOC116259478 [Nymphaea colorata]|nr:uncharacterized protein LOC116259478 [Nymphaea colorata]
MAPRKNLMEFFGRRSPKTPSQPMPDQPDEKGEETGTSGAYGSQGSGSKHRRPARQCVRKLPLDLERDGIEGEGEYEGVADGEGGSGGRKLTKTKGKTTPRSLIRAKRNNASNNEIDNSKGPIGSQNEECSALSSGSDFFVKLSERRKRRKSLQQEKGEHVPGDTTIADEMHQQLRMLKDNLSSGEENGLRGQIRMLEGNHFAASNRSDRSNNGSPAKAIDLRLEAKRAAEENARLFAGKQIHPFFVSCQTSKRLSEVCHWGNRCDSVLQEDMTMPYAPLHVLQTSQEDEVLLNWQDWVVFEGNVLKRADPIIVEDMTLAWLHGSKPLKIDSFVNIPNLAESTFLEQQLERRESGSTASTSCSSLLIGEQNCEVEMEARDRAPVDITRNHVCGELHDERMKPYYLRCSSLQPVANLWVDKYQPDRASEVCGNLDSVKFINEWMHSWYIQNPANDKISSHNDDHEWIEDDDAVNDMYGIALKNILLLTGPIGSGKSAAIYACAKEQGFQIIEVSASDWRSGTVVKQKFREAMESQCLKKWSHEDPVGSQNQHGIGTFPIENKSLECGNSGDLRKVNFESVSCLEQENALEMEVSCNFMECRGLGNQVASKTLILFEDFDATLDEDRGLIATIVELAETTKRPIILTSNSEDPILPPLVDRVTINFTLPSVDELVSHVYMVCVSEAINISLQLIELVVRFCQRDIRKTLMFLQFWCQGRTDQGGNKSLCAYGPVPFNIDAGHYVIKKVIPWGLPSQLSEYIEQEVSKSLAKTKAIALDETITEELSTAENLEDRLGHKNEDMSNNEDGLSKWKLAMHDFALESSILSDISPCKTVETTKQSRQKRRVVVSDSEDEPYIDKVYLSERLPQHLGEESLLDVPNNSFSMQEHPEANHLDATLHENLLGGPKTNGVGCTHYLNGSPEISCIPGLSFVPETEIDNGYLEQISSVACFPDLAQNTCLGSSDMLKELGMEIINLAQTDGEPDRVSETLCWDACDTAAESVPGCNDCHFEPPLAIFRTCPLIDECSRADFSSSFMNKTKPKRLVVADLVQETWKKLRSQGSEIRFCIETEQSASSSLKIASGLTQLISDADVMRTAGCVLFKYPAQASIFDEGDRHVDLMSTFAEHGLCFYAKKSAPIRRHLDPAIELDLASEILVSSMDGLTIGTLVAQESGHGSSIQLKIFEELMEEGMLPDRLEDDSMLSDALLTVVPIRSYLASRGAAFHEYLSFLSQISKGESTRLAQEGKSRKCGRFRGSRHYLRTGPFSMSAEDVLMLDQHACYKKRDPKSIVKVDPT